MKSIFFLMLIMGSLQVYAGQSTALVTAELIEITNPTKAFDCSLGDGGFLPTIVSLNAHSIPTEFGENFRNAPGIVAYFSHQNEGAFSCKDALKAINDEIQKQGGQLKVQATRALSRFAYPDNNRCKLFLTEDVHITVGSLTLSGISTFFINETPISSSDEWFKCRDLIPGTI